jgi:thiaminase/transcriptional activator TenA
MKFTQRLWQEIQPVYSAILDHAFIRELSEGTLSRERFAFYMKQDALYLREFSRALAITGARSPETADMQAYLGFASGAIVVESALHETYFREFGIALDVDASPACFAYTQYLLSTAALGTYPEALAALLPCFWIYREVGGEIAGRAAPRLNDNPYARWIATYSGEEFSVSVDRAIETTERVAQNTTETDRQLMSRAFQRSSRLEWRFWDSAYQLESWPPHL